MLLIATRRKGQPDPDLQPVQIPEHALVSNKQEGPARSWLTICLKPRAWSCQQQAGWASQILTYILFKTQSMILSARGRKGQSDPDLLHSVQNPEHALVSNKQEGPARCWLTYCSKPRACSCQKQVEMVSQMLTYSLFKPKVCCCERQAGKASQMLTYSLYKTQRMLLSATSRERLDALQLTNYLLSLQVCSC